MTRSRFKKIAGRGFIFALLLVAAFSAFAARQTDPPLSPAAKAWVEEPDGCTSIQVGRLATVDGSVITCHTCDGPYRQWLNIVPHQKWPDKAMNKIYSGKMHTETPSGPPRHRPDRRDPPGPRDLPLPEHGLSLLSTKHGLAIGETTIGGRQELVNNEGMFMIEELERLCPRALQDGPRGHQAGRRARQAVRLRRLRRMHHHRRRQGGLALRDLRAPGPSRRAPSGRPSASPTITSGSRPTSRASPRSTSRTPTTTWPRTTSSRWPRTWAGGTRRAASPSSSGKPTAAGKPFSTREFFVLSTLAPSLKLNMDMPELPFSVKPEKKLSVRDVLADLP